MNILKYFEAYKDYILREETWIIAARFIGEEGIPSIIKKSNEKFSFLESNKKYWFADPFVFIDNEICYIFFEMFDRKNEIGKIGYSIYDNNSFSEPKVVIEDYKHLSFPFIFKNKEKEIFIMPESSESSELLIYKAVDFPNIWEKKTVLLKEIKIVDSVIISLNSKNFLLGSTTSDSFLNNNTWIYDFNMKETRISSAPRLFHTGNFGSRNAGAPFYFHDKSYRVGQNNSTKEYGKGLVVYEMEEKNGMIKNRFIKKMYSRDFIEDSYYKGVHTYNFSKGYEVIDLKVIKKNNIFKILKRIFKILLKKIYRSKKNEC